MFDKLKMETYNKNAFSKTDTLIVKGLAIVLMLYHHCFLKSAVDVYGNAINFFPVSQDVAVAICYSFKLCVGMFAFLTGYGLFCSYSKSQHNAQQNTKWVCTRLVKTMSGFWFVFVFTFVITLLIDGYPIERYFKSGAFSVKGFVYVLLDFLGLAKLFDTPSLIGTWWYMSAAIVFIVIFPFLYALCKKFGYIPVMLLASFVPRFIGTGFPGDKNVFSFFLAFLAGMCFSQNNIFEKLNNIKLAKNEHVSNVLTFLIYIAVLVAMVVLTNQVKRKTLWELHFSISAIIVVCFCKRFIAPIPVVRNAFYYIGKHSMNIYLIHTFYRYVYLSNFIYSMRWSVLIHLVLLLMSLATSIVLEQVKRLVKYNALVDKFVYKINYEKRVSYETIS